MDDDVFRQWRSGVMTFRDNTISQHVFDFVRSVLDGIKNKQGSQYTAPPICAHLLVEIQARVDRGEIFLPNAHSLSSSSSFPQPPQATSSRAHSPAPKPGPSRPPSPQAGPSRKRRSQGGGPGRKRGREGTVPTSSPQSSDSDMSLCSPSVSPIINVNPVAPAGRRYMLRTAPRQRELYQEPEQENWGISGTESNAIRAFMTSNRKRSRR